MRIPINLASQPFRRDRPVIVGAVAMSAALVGLLALLISLAAMDRSELRDSRVNIGRLRSQLRTLSAEQVKLDAELRRPENAEVLEHSVFLNTLLYRKGISWTRIFADLEKTVPYNVRIISIRPWVNGQNQVALDMVIGSESPESAMAFLKTLEDSPLFGSVSLHSALPPSQTNPLYQYRVSANYAQKL